MSKKNGKYRELPTYEDHCDDNNDDDFIMDAVRSQRQMLKDQDNVSLVFPFRPHPSLRPKPP